MKTIIDSKNEIIIKKSKFICHLFFVQDINDIKEKLNYINTKYKDATHNCYAYICGNLKKMSDDGEPSGTAGMPILNILETNNLNNTLAVVTRYFGGIKLGANGLIRAYSDSVKDAINNTNIIELIEGINIIIKFNYDNIKQIEYILNNYKIIDKKYNEQIEYTISIPINDDIINKLSPYILNYEIINNAWIQKENLEP